jgi:NAD+ kinase
MRVVVLGSAGRPNMARRIEHLLPLVQQHATIVASDFTGQLDLSEIEADLAIVLGGDGSILRAAHQMGNHQIPVLAVNLGRLGFLADLSVDEAIALLPKLAHGERPVIEHLMFECGIYREGQLVHQDLGLNEVAVLTGPPFAIMDVVLYVDSEEVTTYSCDGLMIATPVGSTAHSLSAGGPILRKDLQAFVISPISPHTLTHRPVVDSADRTYELMVVNPRPETSVVVDGRVCCAIRPGDRVRIQRAEARFKMVCVPGHSYYRTLREKLGWSGRFRLDN